jgi:hypothetical protein
MSYFKNYIFDQIKTRIMKMLFSFLIALLLALTIYSQPPGPISYQAVVRDNAGNILENHAVSFRFSILQNGPTGTTVYKETQSAVTNAFGLVNLSLGTGTVISGSFSSINWGMGSYWLKTEMDVTGGSAYVVMGTEKFLSVPYANYAKSAGMSSVQSLSQAQIDTLSAVAGTCVLNITTGCLNYYTGTVWKEVCGTCTPQPTQANAGPDQVITGNQATLAANTPASGTGHWEILSGTGGTIASPNNPSSTFTGTQPGIYTLQWKISTVCGNSTDAVTISFVTQPEPTAGLQFDPYVDCTLWPNFDISDVASTGIHHYSCAFIVDDQTVAGASPCWGGFPTLGMDYYQDKIASLRSQGGDVIMSFGGANGIELAYAASTEFTARDAYKTVIDAYSLTSIDFDIEGMFVAEPASILRRSKAMKLLQNEYPTLKISLTLPVMPTGLTNDGLNVVASALGQNVNISCVNVMAMDYGSSGIDMGNAAISAGEALFLQLKTLYQNAGQNLADSLIWHKVGITPMIGQNDVSGEIFYQSDANDVASWAVQKHIGRLALWSVNRDKQCSAPGDPLYSCSHVTQTLYEFSGIFGSVSENP